MVKLDVVLQVTFQVRYSILLGYSIGYRAPHARSCRALSCTPCRYTVACIRRHRRPCRSRTLPHDMPLPSESIYTPPQQIDRAGLIGEMIKKSKVRECVQNKIVGVSPNGECFYHCFRRVLRANRRHEFYYILVLLFMVMRGDGSLPRKAPIFLPEYVYGVATVCPYVAGAAGPGTSVWLGHGVVHATV